MASEKQGQKTAQCARNLALEFELYETDVLSSGKVCMMDEEPSPRRLAARQRIIDAISTLDMNRSYS